LGDKLRGLKSRVSTPAFPQYSSGDIALWRGVMDVVAKNRWFQILFDYRKDYKKKHLAEIKAKKIKQQLDSTEDEGTRTDLKKRHRAVLAEIKNRDEYLLKKYRLKRLLQPFNFIDNDFQVSPFILPVEVLSQKGHLLTVRIDRMYSYDAIQKHLVETLKNLDVAEGKKIKKSGRPKRIHDPNVIRDCAKHWHDHFLLLQKNPEIISDDAFQTKIKSTMVSELVLDELTKIFPYLKKSTLREYAKPFHSKKS